MTKFERSYDLGIQLSPMKASIIQNRQCRQQPPDDIMGDDIGRFFRPYAKTRPTTTPTTDKFGGKGDDGPAKRRKTAAIDLTQRTALSLQVTSEECMAENKRARHKESNSFGGAMAALEQGMIRQKSKQDVSELGQARKENMQEIEQGIEQENGRENDIQRWILQWAQNVQATLAGALNEDMTRLVWTCK
jgi:hypothetical protein